MRGLPALLASTEGRDLLEGRGVHLREAAFLERLRPPQRPGLSDLVGIAGSLVYVAHQLLADYGPSVTAKMRALRDLERRPRSAAGVYLWLDMDRSGSERSSGAIRLRGRGGVLQVRLVLRRDDEKETRFVPIDPAVLLESRRRMKAWARQHGASASDRYVRIEEDALVGPHETLADLNLAITAFLLRDYLAAESPSILVSELVNRDLLTEAVEEVVGLIDDVVNVFNSAVASLAAADVDPQVGPLPPDYLPLHYSCDRDGRRHRLAHERRGADHFAVTTCRCGVTYRFHLGTGDLSIAELVGTGRWSTDVTLPLYLSQLASGVIAGRSSALYGLVLNEVSEKVLARSPIPMLVPEELQVLLAGIEEGPVPPGSLLTDYLLTT